MNAPVISCPRRPGWRSLLVLGATMILMSGPVAADSWYEHYARAEQALEGQDWAQAIQELNQALQRKGDSGARVRSYGMNVISYFPYLKLGIAYHHLGQFDAALQAFETEARLGAVAQSERARAELEHYRGLASAAQAEAANEERQRIRQLVDRSLRDARELESRGLLGEAMAAVDQALSVAPDDSEAQSLMGRLRQRYADLIRGQEQATKASRLAERGRALLGEGRFDEAASVFRQALHLQPDAEIQRLFDLARRGLLDQLGAGTRSGDLQAATSDGLAEVRRLESAGNLAAALNRLQAVLALAPDDKAAQETQRRLLQAQQQVDSENDRLSTIRALLAEASARFEAGSAEQALAAANRVLALDPVNGAALRLVSTAYGAISRRLLGLAPRGNIPPAVRFVDMRTEGDDGTLVQTITSPDFRLNGVVIDESPVEVAFFDEHGGVVEAALEVQPLGGFYLTEFHVASRLPPGRSSLRLVATDSEGLVSSSQYAVVYARPLLRAPWFYAVLIVAGAVVIGGFAWRRLRRREALRRRHFNPYIAGAPVIEEEMFFGRRELVDRILQTIHHNSLLIYGERRIGKTSIQHQLRTRLRALEDPQYEFHPVYVDLQGTPEARFFRTIAEDIYHQLGPVLEGLAPGSDLTGPYGYRDFVRDIHAVFKVLRARTSKKVKLVLLIDEVDELNDYDPRINQKLRSLFMKDFSENLVAVVSGVQIKKQWEMEGSPWYNFFEEIEVRPFGAQEARELIERPIAGMFKLEDGVVERIIALTSGRPYLIQKLCIALVTRLHEDNRRTITLGDVDALGGLVQA